MENLERATWRRDPYIRAAKERLRSLFREQPDGVFYLKQLEVLLERDFFHWVIVSAVNELLAEGSLKSEEVPLFGPTRLKIIVAKNNRYYRRAIANMVSIVREYSAPEIAT